MNYPKKPVLIKAANYKQYRNTYLYLTRFQTHNLPVLFIANGESSMIAICNINPEDYELEEFEFAIKNYSENEGMLEWLIDHDVMNPPHKTFRQGWVDFPVCYATDELKARMIEIVRD